MVSGYIEQGSVSEDDEVAIYLSSTGDGVGRSMSIVTTSVRNIYGATSASAGNVVQLLIRNNGHVEVYSGDYLATPGGMDALI